MGPSGEVATKEEPLVGVATKEELQVVVATREELQVEVTTKEELQVEVATKEEPLVGGLIQGASMQVQTEQVMLMAGLMMRRLGLKQMASQVYQVG